MKRIFFSSPQQQKSSIAYGKLQCYCQLEQASHPSSQEERSKSPLNQGFFSSFRDFFSTYFRERISVKRALIVQQARKRRNCEQLNPTPDGRKHTRQMRFKHLENN